MTTVNENVFTEAALVDSILYKTFNNNAALTGTILSAIKNSIVIDSSYIEEQLMQIRRTKFSPLSDSVLQAYADGDIILLYAKNTKVPQALPFFVTKKQSKFQAFIFVNNFGSITKSDVDSSVKYLNITMKDLYVLMEGAYVGLRYAFNPIKVKRTLGLMKLSANIYTDMVMRILNKECSISMDQDLYGKVSFCIGEFFLRNIWMSENEEVNFTYALNTIHGDKGVNRAEYLMLAETMEQREIKDINLLIEFLRELSPRMKNMNFRYFTQCYINMFKAPAMFSMECLPYFLFTIQTSMIGSFIVNQPMISDITKNIKGMNMFYPELVKAVS